MQARCPREKEDTRVNRIRRGRDRGADVATSFQQTLRREGCKGGIKARKIMSDRAKRGPQRTANSVRATTARCYNLRCCFGLHATVEKRAMKFILVGIGGLILLTVVAAVIATRIKKQKDKLGFREFVKQPELFDEYVAEMEGEELAENEFASWGEDEISEQINRYVSGADDSRGLRSALQSLTPKTHAPLIGILNKGRVKRKRLDAAAIERLCELFDGTIPVEAISLLEPYLTHESDRIRKECVLAVAESGRAEALPAMKRALKDEDEFVRSYALIGLGRAIQANRLASEVVDGILPDLEELVRKDQNGDKAPALLAQLDPKRATQFFLSAELFDADKRQLYNVLRVINAFDLEVSRDQILSLIQELRTREMDFPNDYAFGESLALLGRFKVAEDEVELQKYSEHPNEEVAEGAARGIVAANDLGDFRNRIWEKEEAGQPLTTEQQHYKAVLILDAEVNNGGHSQYFFNSSGDQWQSALEGLKAMGFKERLSVFEDVLKLFGEDGLTVDRSKRSGQLADVYTEHEESFDELDGRYYQSEENVEVMMMRYVVRNAEAFK